MSQIGLLEPFQIAKRGGNTQINLSCDNFSIDRTYFLLEGILRENEIFNLSFSKFVQKKLTICCIIIVLLYDSFKWNLFPIGFSNMCADHLLQFHGKKIQIKHHLTLIWHCCCVIFQNHQPWKKNLHYFKMKNLLLLFQNVPSLKNTLFFTKLTNVQVVPFKIFCWDIPKITV